MLLVPGAGISRRGFLGLGLAAAGLAALPRRAGAFQPVETKRLFEWKSLHAKAWAAIGQGGNSLVISDGGEALLVDTKMPVFGDILRREAEGVVGKVSTVLNTHHHADHTGGNHAFTKDVAVLTHTKAEPRIVAQVDRYLSGIKSAVGDMTKSSAAERELVADDFKRLHDRMGELRARDFAPTGTFEDGHEVSVGGVKVVLRHFGAGHTDNDAVVHVPSLNLVHTGDLLFQRVYPYIDRDGGATTVGWRASLRKVMELCDEKTVVVPGHGGVCGRAALNEQIEYFDRMCEFVAGQIKEGKSREDVAKMNPKPYDTYSNEWIRAIALRGIYEELGEKK
ncbi:MAG: MBL fold metallo-hydrolase [Phycisphaerae bacterium]|nr:MBL fold metallo-hydrolase [Phycisphaerae bacterium]